MGRDGLGQLPFLLFCSVQVPVKLLGEILRLKPHHEQNLLFHDSMSHGVGLEKGEHNGLVLFPEG